MLLALAIVLYLAAMVFHHGRWPMRGPRARRHALVCVAAGAVLNLAGIVIGSGPHGGWPLIELRQTLALFGLAVPLVYVGVLRGESDGLALLAYPVAALGLVASIIVPPPKQEATFRLHALMQVHVIIAVFAYAAFALAFSCGVAYLVKEALLKRKHFTGLAAQLPALDSAEALGYRLAGSGFVLWTLMIAIGAGYAELIAGQYWGWTPKQMWSLITWVVYAVYLHTRVLAQYRGRTTVAFLIVGFACACATYLMTNYLGDPYHL
jgi:ABC-type uncharacterized transport system permease subunit